MEKNLKKETNFADIESKLKAYLFSAKKELLLNEIEKIIINELGCEKIKSKQGSAMKYFHPLLEKYPQFGGRMSVHLIHGGKSQPKITKHDFKNYLWPPLELILKELKGECNV